MNIKKWPYWLKSGCIVGIIGTVFSSFLTENVTNLAYTPWWAAWFIIPTFIIAAIMCIIFRVDFISESNSTYDRNGTSVITCVSIFLTWFLIGALASIIIRKAKNRFRVDTR